VDAEEKAGRSGSRERDVGTRKKLKREDAEDAVDVA
jgi:hypothetical protein